jgi:hypothetical protein
MNRLFTALAVALLLVCSVSAQVAVTPMPNAKPQFFTKGGSVCSACTISTFVGGTTTPLATYTDSTGAVTNPVTITLDSAGYPPNQIWLGPFTYKFVFKDALGVTTWTVDNITSITSIPYARTDRANAWTLTQTFNGISTNTLNSIVYADRYSTLTDACTAAGVLGTIIVSKSITVAASVATPSTCSVEVKAGGSFAIATGQVLTINGPFSAPVAQVFSGLGTVAGLTFAYPEWWGNVATCTTGACPSISSAVNALSAIGGTVKLQSAHYRSGFDKLSAADYSSVAFMTKLNVHIVGSANPDYNGSYTQLVNGSIIEGGFYVRASGFIISDAGVDTGSVVQAAFYPTYTALESMDITGALPGDPTLYPKLTNIEVKNFKCLGKGFSTPDHCLIIEDADGARVDNVQTVYHVHGFVYKGVGLLATSVYSRGSSGEDIIIKSDTYSISSTNSLVNAKAAALLSAGDSGGITVQAGTAAITKTNLTNNTADGTSYGLSIEGALQNDTVQVDSFAYNTNVVGGTGKCIRTVGAGPFFDLSVTGFACSNSGGISTSNITTQVFANGILDTTTGDAFNFSNNASLSNVAIVGATGAGVNAVSGTATIANVTGSTTGAFVSGAVRNLPYVLTCGGTSTCSGAAQC